MDQRERVLLIVLVGLVLAAGFYYRGTIGSYLPLGDDESETNGGSQSGVNTEELVTRSVERYRKALRRSLKLQSLNFEKIDRSNGLSGTVRFRLSLESDTPLPLETVAGQFEGGVLTDGLPRGTAQVTEPRRDSTKNWVFRARDRNLFVSAADEMRMRFDGVGLVSGVPFSPGLSEMPGSPVLDRTEWRWQSRPVYAVEIEADTGSKFLYISRDQPHRLLGVTAGYNPGWSRRIRYDSAVISTIKTYRDETLVRKFQNMNGDGTRLVLARGGSGQSGRLRFSFRPVEDGLDVQLGMRGRDEDSFSSLGEGTVAFENGRPSAVSMELLRKNSGGRLPEIRLQMNADRLQLVDQVSSDLEDTSVYESGTLPELLSGLFHRPDTDDREPEVQDEERSSVSDRETPATETPSGVRPDGSTEEKADTTRSRRRSRESRDQRTEVLYPENSGETVVRRIRTNFKLSKPPPGFKQARSQYRRGNIDAARKQLEELVDTYPRSINAHYTLGMIHYEAGRAGSARGHLRTVVSLGHDSQLVEWSRAYLSQLDPPEPTSNSLSSTRPEG